MCLPQWKIGHFRSGLSIETTALDYKNGCVLSSDYLSYRAAFGARVQCGHPRSSKLISMFGSKHKAHLCIILSSYKGKKDLIMLKFYSKLLPSFLCCLFWRLDMQTNGDIMRKVSLILPKYNETWVITCSAAIHIFLHFEEPLFDTSWALASEIPCHEAWWNK